MSTLAVNTITNAAGGNTAQINGMTPTADSLQGFRNRIINGDMRIDQRNNGAALTVNSTSSFFAVDRTFYYGTDTAGVFTGQQSAIAPVGFTNSILSTVTTASTPSGNQEYGIRQAIEGFNIADLNWGTANAKAITLSFWVRSSLTGTFAGSVTNNAYNRAYVFTYTINSANTFEYKTVTISGDTTGTWLTNNSAGLRLQFNLGAGPGRIGTPDVWGSSYIQSATGAVNLISTNGATLFLTGVQLEAGAVATPFERRDYGRELAMCQRYFETGSVASSGLRAGISGGFRYSALDRSFAVNKRAAPTMGLSGLTFVQASAAEVGVLTQSEFSVSVVVTFANANYQLSGGLFTASAEL